MTEKKYKKETIKLDEEMIKRAYKQLGSEDLNLQASIISRDALSKQIEFDMPMKQAKMQLEQLDEAVKRHTMNVHALKKQIRTKKIMRTVPK